MHLAPPFASTSITLALPLSVIRTKSVIAEVPGV
jgi:hypothetical protein